MSEKLAALRREISELAAGLAEMQRRAAAALHEAQVLGEELGIAVTNHRGARELEWLISEASRDAVADAAACLPGERRAYPLNVSKALGIVLPEALKNQAGVELEAVKGKLSLLRAEARLRELLP